MTGEEFTAADLAACAEREVLQRRKVYPRWVGEKRMSQEFADRQIAMMRRIAADYHAKVEADPQASGRLV